MPASTRQRLRLSAGPEFILCHSRRRVPARGAAPARNSAFRAILSRHRATRMRAESWEEDWRVMQLPGRMDKERALIADYARYVARFGAIAGYLRLWQPPALMIWGRHDPFFELAEVLSWMQDLPRMEVHVLDAGHMLLETHATAAASLMLDFICRPHAQRSQAGNA